MISVSGSKEVVLIEVEEEIVTCFKAGQFMKAYCSIEVTEEGIITCVKASQSEKTPYVIDFNFFFQPVAVGKSIRSNCFYSIQAISLFLFFNAMASGVTFIGYS